MNFAAIDWVIVIAYLAGSLLIGVAAKRFVGNLSDFLVAGRELGLYVGIVPIFLGVLWYPFMRRLSRSAMNFILALTVGLLVYLAIGTWLDANEFAAELPAFWQGVPLIIIIAFQRYFTQGLLAGSVK